MRVLVVTACAIGVVFSNDLSNGTACAPVGAQCGGNEYNGTTCCADGNMCKPGGWPYYNPPNPTYEHCVPECASARSQCGGNYWRGVTCCASGSTCTAQNNYFSSCVADIAPVELPEVHVETATPVSVPADDCAAPMAQCGGTSYNGTTCCTEGTMCKPGGWPYYSPPHPTYEHCVPECSPARGQCGGQYWRGVTCCASGSTCTAHNDYFSSCVNDTAPTELPEDLGASPVSLVGEIVRPVLVAAENCAAPWAQCGGVNYNGTTCCSEGNMCKPGGWPYYTPSRPRYEHCIPECATAGGQCGGEYWRGVTCCPTSYTCTAQNDYFSSCVNATAEQPTLAAAAITLVQLDDEECVAPLAQCGGSTYNGTTTCCTEGNMCKPGGWPMYDPPNPAYEHCMPECAAARSQCGGRFWRGVTCCASGSNCTAHNAFYSSCVPDPAPAQSPQDVDVTTGQPTLEHSSEDSTQEVLDERVASDGLAGASTFPLAVAGAFAAALMLGAVVLCKRTSRVQEEHDGYQSFLSA